MKYLRLSLYLISLVILIAMPIRTGAKGVNSDYWTQYRYNSYNNPVLEIEGINKLNRTITTKNEVRSTPVVVEDKVFVGNHDTGNLSAYNLQTGELLWENQAPNWVHSEIIYADDQLFVGYGNRFFQDNGIRGTGDSGLLSLDLDNGETLWDYQTEGHVMPTPAFYDGTVYITTGDKHLYGINPKEGTEEWSLELGSVISMSAPNIKDGILYVGGSSPYKFFAVDLDEEKMKWEMPFEKVTSGLDDVPPVVSDEGLVYTTGVQDTDDSLSIKEVFNKDGAISSYKQMIKITIGGFIGKEPQMDYEHKLYAMDINDGTVEWEKSLGKGPMVSNNKSGAPILYDNKVFVGSPITESFYAYDADDGEQLWKYESHINKAPPVADNGVVYFTDTKGLVYGFDTESGDLLGRKLLGGKLAPAGPMLVNDHLMVGSQDTNVYSVSTEEILQADDSVDDDNNLLSYIFFIYVFPIGGLIVGIAIVVLIIRFGMRKLKGSKV